MMAMLRRSGLAMVFTILKAECASFSLQYCAASPLYPEGDAAVESPMIGGEIVALESSQVGAREHTAVDGDFHAAAEVPRNLSIAVRILHIGILHIDTYAF